MRAPDIAPLVRRPATARRAGRRTVPGVAYRLPTPGVDGGAEMLGTGLDLAALRRRFPLVAALMLELADDDAMAR